MTAGSNRSRRRASSTRRRTRAGSPSFVGDINLFEGEVIVAANSGRLMVTTRDGGTIVVAAPRQRVAKAAVDGRDPSREGQAVAPRPGGGRRPCASINRLEGVVTDVGYLGGSTVYKVRLDSGAVVRASMANTARLDRDAYGAGQRVVAWFTPDDCMVLEQ